MSRHETPGRLRTVAAIAALMALAPSTVLADPRYEAVKALGALNGVALHCKYLDEVSRMKLAIVENAPKERSFGLAFDESTNAAFLAHIEAGAACPGKAGFSERVSVTIGDLEQVFATE